MKGKAHLALSGLFAVCLACATTPPAEKPHDPPPQNPSLPPVEKPVERPVDKPVENPVQTLRINDELRAYHGPQDAAQVISNIEKKVPREQLARDDKLVFGNLLLADQRFTEAKAVFQTLVNKDSHDRAALMALALVEGALGDPNQEKNLLDHLLELFPTDPEANTTYGNLLLADGKTDAAQSRFQKAGNYAEALLGLGRIALGKKDTDQALAMLNRAQALDPKNDTIWSALSQVYADRDQPVEAEKAINQALALAPNFAWHYLDRARLSWLKLLKTDQAMADLNKVIELDPTNFFGHVYRGEIRESRDDVAGGYGDYAAALAQQPDYRYAYPPMAVLSFTQKDWESAQKYGQEAFKDYPGEYGLPLIAALSLKKLGRPEDAKKVLDGAYRKFPQGSLISEAIRFMLNPKSDFALNSMLMKETDVVLKTRIQVYQAVQYWFDNQPKSAKVILADIAEKTYRNVPEIRMARLFLKELE